MKTIRILYSRASKQGYTLAQTLVDTVKIDSVEITKIDTGVLKKGNPLRVLDKINDSDFTIAILDQSSSDCLVEIGYSLGIDSETTVALLPDSRPPTTLEKMRSIFLRENNEENVDLIHTYIKKILPNISSEKKESRRIKRIDDIRCRLEADLKNDVFKAISKHKDQFEFEIDSEKYRKYGADFALISKSKDIRIIYVIKKATQNFPIDGSDIQQVCNIAKDAKATKVCLVTFFFITETAASWLKKGQAPIQLFDIAEFIETPLKSIPELFDHNFPQPLSQIENMRPELSKLTLHKKTTTPSKRFHKAHECTSEMCYCFKNK